MWLCKSLMRSISIAFGQVCNCKCCLFTSIQIRCWLFILTLKTFEKSQHVYTSDTSIHKYVACSDSIKSNRVTCCFIIRRATRASHFIFTILFDNHWSKYTSQFENIKIECHIVTNLLVISCHKTVGSFEFTLLPRHMYRTVVTAHQRVMMDQIKKI